MKIFRLLCQFYCTDEKIKFYVLVKKGYTSLCWSHCYSLRKENSEITQDGGRGWMPIKDVQDWSVLRPNWMFADRGEEEGGVWNLDFSADVISEWPLTKLFFAVKYVFFFPLSLHIIFFRRHSLSERVWLNSKTFKPMPFFALRPRYQNFMDPRYPRYPRQNLTHATHAIFSWLINCKLMTVAVDLAAYK